jgi:O-antigen ligase
VNAAINTGGANHNAEGAMFTIALGILLTRFSCSRHPAGRLVLAGGIAALSVGIAYSFSRSAYFGALAVIVLFAARRSIRGLAGTVAAVSCLTPLLPAAVGARLTSVWNPSGLDISSALRLDLWSSALRMFRAHPFFGVGYLNFASRLPRYYVNTGNYSTAVIQFSQLEFAHNTYLTVLAVSGLLGAVLISGLVVAGWRRAWLLAKAGHWAGEGALLAFIGVGVCSAFGEVLLVPPIFTAFLLTVLAAGPARGEVT